MYKNGEESCPTAALIQCKIVRRRPGPPRTRRAKEADRRLIWERRDAGRKHNEEEEEA